MIDFASKGANGERFKRAVGDNRTARAYEQPHIVRCTFESVLNMGTKLAGKVRIHMKNCIRPNRSVLAQRVYFISVHKRANTAIHSAYTDPRPRPVTLLLFSKLTYRVSSIGRGIFPWNFLSHRKPKFDGYNVKLTA